MNQVSTILFLLTCVFLPAYAAAAPTVTLTAASSNAGRTIVFTVRPSSDATGCTYTVVGGATKRKVTTNAASLTGGATSTAAEAEGLPKLQTPMGRRKIRVYFKVTAACSDGTQTSPIISVSVPGSPSARATVSKWVKAIAKKVKKVDLQLSRVWSNLSFDAPLDLQYAGDSRTTVYVVEQGGRIWKITDINGTPVKTLFLDISGRISTGGERGLLGLAFHPSFTQNGLYYVNYTEASTGTTVIARYNALLASPVDSETRLLTQEQPFENHNGGGLAFGKDGFLYIGLGDGGSGGDPQGNGQKMTTLLGKMLRIDVNRTEGTKQYGIPTDNPFRANTQGIKEEIFASGLRNPYRFSFDAATGDLWVGDVGQNAFEEIDIVTIGKNYGWNVLEGTQCYPAGTTCDSSAFAPPVIEYPHAPSASVTGGYVYRGTKNPALIGRYIFGDFVTGQIWSGGKAGDTEELFDTDILISSFGVDGAGELYMLSYEDGAVYRFSPAG